MKKFEEVNNLKFSYISKQDENLSPILELYRGKVYSNILKNFISSCTEKLNSHIFSQKKSYPRTITNLLSSWFFTLYVDYDFKNDPFFPDNYNNTESLEETLFDFCKYDSNLINYKVKINNIINDLKTSYKESIKNLSEYKNSDKYLSLINDYQVEKEEKIQIRNGDELIFYKFTIKIPFKFKDKRQENIINNILLPKSIYIKLKNQYNGPEDKLDIYLWCIIYRYQLLGSNNNQLGVLPNILNKMKNDFGLEFECFASAINSTFTNYCSIYYDLEKFFGSKGNFFDLNPINGTYSFNPPYQKNVMEKGINKLIQLLEKSTLINEKLTFIITIPIWDKIGKKIMKFSYPEKRRTPDIEYNEFNIINDVFKSKFFKAKLMVPKDKFTYIDHNFQLLKNVTIQHTYILVLSNDNIDFQKKLNEYKFEVEVNITV
tara:strand:- start:54 stop:1349 length:1296 start_codon:yes stop_codon:yes gene_type:complete